MEYVEEVSRKIGVELACPLCHVLLEIAVAVVTIGPSRRADPDVTHWKIRITGPGGAVMGN